MTCGIEWQQLEITALAVLVSEYFKQYEMNKEMSLIHGVTVTPKDIQMENCRFIIRLKHNVSRAGNTLSICVALLPKFFFWS